MLSHTFKWVYDGKKAFISGSFCNWTSAILMYKINDVWEATIELPCGLHQYKFIIDDIWCYDITAPTVNDNFGSKNNVIHIKNNQHEKIIVCISDTLNQFPPIIPDGDILVHCGDFSLIGHPDEYTKFNTWLGHLMHPYKIIILGKNDINYMIKNNMDPIIESKKLITNGIVLCSEKINIMGINFYGIQWYWFHNWDFTYITGYEKDRDEWYIPPETDVLITHGPPYKILDIYDCGSKNLLKKIKQCKPKLHLFGNICEKYGSQKKVWNDLCVTKFINASLVDRNSLQIKNNPIVVKL